MYKFKIKLKRINEKITCNFTWIVNAYQMTACNPESQTSDGDSITDTAIPSETTAPMEDEVKEDGLKYQQYASMPPEEIVAELTLEQKVAQMLQPAVYNVTEKDMLANDYGSILSQTPVLIQPRGVIL